MDPALNAQLEIYKPWFFIAAVFVLFALLRFVRKSLRRRVDEIGGQVFGDDGWLIWFWLNAPGVILHELSHAAVILLFYPFDFRITSITLFHIKPRVKSGSKRNLLNKSRRTWLQLGEVEYNRPPGKVSTHIGDGLSAVAPLFGGILAFLFLYWVATGYTLWDAWQNPDLQHLHRPDWPWWTLTFAPYLILTVTSELWPSHQDWRGARRLIICLLLLTVILLFLLWLGRILIFNRTLLLSVSSISNEINFALLILLGLDAVFFVLADLIARIVGT